MSSRIDTAHTWYFCYPGEDPIPIKIDQNTNNKEFSFFVPYGGLDKGLHIVANYDTEHPNLRGKYTYCLLDSSEIQTEVIFKIFANGRCLKGYPEGFCNLEEWCLLRDDYQKSSAPSPGKPDVYTCSLL